MPVNDTPPPPIRQQPSCALCKYREFDWQTWRSRCTLGPGRPIEGDENRLVCDAYQPEREIDPPAPATIDPAIAALRTELAEVLSAAAALRVAGGAARDALGAELAALRAELAEAQAELRAVRAALAETGARLARAVELLADGVEVARIGSELATADQLGEWWNVQGFQDEAAYFLAGGWATAPTTPPGGEKGD